MEARVTWILIILGAQFIKKKNSRFGPCFHTIFPFLMTMIKVSYCCTKNLGNIIKSHNKKVISSNNQIIIPCNCKKEEECLFEGKCRANVVVYKCIASATGFPVTFI